ncbi:protein translocase subunit SecD [Sphingomonas sanxanigenens]|uniref:Protein translocase subunit SecD n=1 Tax=Sphingomonas sanxanigenens DSM 19645 = NX02 TaxID=1123269 RepID=W0ABL7_9SPHN|nr:protein translocase subunit SecD [Sphingomonas sanxanigenens]AHE54471.1 hypothetical protein NX02_13895 [Sphingomonas sanxanigenens DSM 19645 = NX02]
MLIFPRWKKLLIWAIIVFGVLCAVPSFLPERVLQPLPGFLKPRISLGLDLAGGSHLLLEANADEVAKLKLTSMEEQVRTELRRAGAPRIAIGDISSRDGRLVFMVRDQSQVDAAVERIRPLTQGAGMTGQRDFDVTVRDGNTINVVPTEAGIKAGVDAAMEVATEIIRKRIDSLGTREATIVRQGSTRILVQVPGVQDPAQVKNLIGQTAKLEFKLVADVSQADLLQNRAPAGTQILPYPTNPGGIPVIAVQRQVMVSGEELTDAQQAFEPQSNEPVVGIRFNGSGAKKFARVTTDNVGKPFAIILDGVVLSAPNINEPITGGSAQISGSFTVESANQLAIALKSGSLPVKLNVVDERTVGPDLGADSIRAGLIASAVAAAAVIVFMFVSYGRFGIYANIAVVINVLVILGVMGIFGATLTLPGIAGFVLTIGTAVDANVLVYERIREERRRGRSVMQSVEFGYKEASRTIFEANVTHAIAGGIMLFMGSGPVKGFALVLLIGIATSVFTAVMFTRMLAAGWLHRTRPTELVI